MDPSLNIFNAENMPLLTKCNTITLSIHVCIVEMNMQDRNPGEAKIYFTYNFTTLSSIKVTCMQHLDVKNKLACMQLILTCK